MVSKMYALLFSPVHREIQKKKIEKKKKKRRNENNIHTASLQAATKPTINTTAVAPGTKNPKRNREKKSQQNEEKHVDVVRVMCGLHRKRFHFCEYLTTTSRKPIVTIMPFRAELPL